MYIRMYVYTCLHTYVYSTQQQLEGNLQCVYVCTYTYMCVCCVKFSLLVWLPGICTYVCMCVQLDLTYLHTPVMNESGDKARELDK